MSRRTKFYAAVVAVAAVVLPAVAVECLTWPRDVPATSIPDGQDLPNEQHAPPRVTHQPTILKADATRTSPVGSRSPMSPTPDGFQDYVTDGDSATLRQASPDDFLPIPSLGTVEQR